MVIMGGFNVMELKLKHSRWVMRSRGLEARLLQLDNGSSVHCWLPAGWHAPLPPHSAAAPHHHHHHHDQPPTTTNANANSRKPALLLLHGFGTDGTIGWERQVTSFASHYSLFIPDLLFFGQSSTTSKQRSEIFQAECMFKMMEKLGVSSCMVCGHSYGGFVAYRMAHLYPNYIERVIIMSSGILMDAISSNTLLLDKFGASSIEDFLIPHSALDFKKGLDFIFHRPPWLPSFVFQDIFEILSGDQQGRHELINGIILGKRNSPPLPKIDQDVLIIWGDHDQVFNLELAYSLKEFLGDKATLEVIKDVGHMPQMEKPRDVNMAVLKFLNY